MLHYYLIKGGVSNEMGGNDIHNVEIWMDGWMDVGFKYL